MKKKKLERIFAKKNTTVKKEIDPIILANVQFTDQSIRGKDCSAGDAGQENRFLSDHEHSVPTLFGITCGKNNVIDIMTKAMRDKNLEEFPDDATLNKYGAKCVWVSGVTQIEQFWVALNNFFTYGLQPIPMHKMSQLNRNGKPIQRPNCFTVGDGIKDTDVVRIWYTEENLQDSEMPVTVNVLDLMKHMHEIGHDESQEDKLNGVGRMLVEIFKAWNAPHSFLTWPTLENKETEAMRAAELQEKFIAGYQGRALQSARSNGNHFFQEVLGTIFLPENQTHSGNSQTDSLETIITGVVELGFKNRLDEIGLNFDTMFCENDGPPTTADVIDEVYTRTRAKITAHDAEEMLQSYEDLFGDDNKFAKFRLRQTNIKNGNGTSNEDDFTKALRQAGLPEGAQYEGKVKNSVYAVCQVQPQIGIGKFMHENELHKVTVDGEPELTAVVEAYVLLHAKIDMIMTDVDVKRMICDQNENVEMIRHTQALGKWIEDKVSALQLEHVCKRRRQMDSEMSDVGDEEENVSREQVPLTSEQKSMITTVAEQYIRDAKGEQGQDVTRLQQHFAATDASKIPVPSENDPLNALGMLNEAQGDKMGFRTLTNTERAQEMMREILETMMSLDVPNWEAAMKLLNYEPNLLHIEVPYVIRALVGNQIRTLYESQELTVPLFFKPVHQITETKSIRLEEEASVVEGWQEWEWPHCVADLLAQVEMDAPKILEQTHSELIRILPGEYNMVAKTFQDMATATEQEQEALTDRLLTLYECRPTNKPRTWAEAIRLKYGDITTFQVNEPQVQQAVEYLCTPLDEYAHDNEDGPNDDTLTEDKRVMLAVYARWRMYGKMARLMCVPTCKKTKNEEMETTVENWIRTGCQTSDLSMSLKSCTDLRTIWAGNMQYQNQSDTANELRMAEVRNQECWEVCQRVCQNQAAKTGGTIRMRLEYKMFHNRNESQLSVRGLLAIFAAISKTIHKDYVLSTKTGTEATSMGREYKNIVLARAHYWSKMKHPFDIRAYSTNVEETTHGVLVQLTEALPAKWFMAAFGGQGLKIEPYEYKPINYGMKDVVGIAKPNTGVQKFHASGWELAGATGDRICFDWMKTGCTRGDNCSYKHHPQKHKCLRNINDPTRVRKKLNNRDRNKDMIVYICNREHGQLGSTRRRKHGGKQPTGGKQEIANRGLGQEKSKKQKGGGGDGRQEWHHRQAAHEQLEGGRCGKIEGGNWLRRKRNTDNSQLQITERGTKGGYHMRASGWRVLGTESQGTGAGTILRVVGEGSVFKRSQGKKKLDNRMEDGLCLMHRKKKKQRKQPRHISAREKKKVQTAHHTTKLDIAKCKHTDPTQKIKVQTTHKTENTAGHEQTPGPKYKIHSTLYENGKWNGGKKRSQEREGEKNKKTQVNRKNKTRKDDTRDTQTKHHNTEFWVFPYKRLVIVHVPSNGVGLT
jgi:hypothetical protein